MKYHVALEVAENLARLCLLSFDECSELLASLDLDAELADIFDEEYQLRRIESAIEQVRAHGAAILEASETAPDVLH